MTELRLERRGRVALLTLDRPKKKNAFDAAQYERVRDALAGLLADDDVRTVVITGGGGDFSAGADLSAAGAEAARTFPLFLEALSTFEKPLLAAVRGVAVGVGATLLLHCDVVYLGEGARLRYPFAALGLVPEAGSSLLLPAAIGHAAAAEILYTAEWLPAKRAHALGLATRVLPDDEVLDAALAKAAEMAENPVGALRAAKRLLLAPRRAALAEALAREEAAMREQAATPEAREALRAFAKRHGS